MEYPVYDIEGNEVERINLCDDIWNIEPNEKVVLRAVKHHLACRRQGTSSTKTRGEVSGSTRKLWRQKGTGRARVGDRRSPIWRGGGVVFGPKPKDWNYSLPKKEKRLALISSLSYKARNNELKIVNEINLDVPKTKKMENILKSLDILKKKVLLVVEKADADKKSNVENVKLSARNLPGVEISSSDLVHCYEVVNCDVMLLTKKSVKDIETRLLKGDRK